MKYSRRRVSRRHKRRSQKQRGAGWAYTGPAFTASAGVPVDSRTWTDDCAVTARPMPIQAGGACGCMGSSTIYGKQNGGGAGTGGYGFDISNNDMGKAYASLTTGSCPPPATASPLMKGGASDADLYGQVSYSAGYGYTKPVEVNGVSYMDPVPYGKSCMGGGRRYRKSRKVSRKGRKSMKKSRKSHKAGRKH